MQCLCECRTQLAGRERLAPVHVRNLVMLAEVLFSVRVSTCHSSSLLGFRDSMSSAFFTIAAQADSRIKKDKKPVSRDKFGASHAKAFMDRLYIKSGVSSFVYFRITGGGGRMSASTASFFKSREHAQERKIQKHMLRDHNSIQKIS